MFKLTQQTIQMIEKAVEEKIQGHQGSLSVVANRVTEAGHSLPVFFAVETMSDVEAERIIEAQS